MLYEISSPWLKMTIVYYLTAAIRKKNWNIESLIQLIIESFRFTRFNMLHHPTKIVSLQLDTGE